MDMIEPPFRARLLEELEEIRQAVLATTECRLIMDADWFVQVQRHIERAASEEALASDGLVLLWEMTYPWRGTAWLREAQEQLRRGEVDLQCGAHLAVLMMGDDPLESLMPRIDRRLAALRGCGLDRKAIMRKLGEIRANRFNSNVVRHLFEASVLGHFAEHRALRSIEPPPSFVDGAIELDGRLVYVEATHTKHELFPRDARFFSMCSSTIIDAVQAKVGKKISEGKQIARIDDAPAVLFLGLNQNGPGQIEAGIAMQEIFGTPDGRRLSGAVVSDSWKLLVTKFLVNQDAVFPLTECEVKQLSLWFGKASPS